MRLSNFLLWQAAYSELLFLDTLWPDSTSRRLSVRSSHYSRARTPLRRRGERTSRSHADRLVLIAACAACRGPGRDVFAVVVAAIATPMFYEWTRLVRGWGAVWYVGGFLYALAAGAGAAVDPGAR